MVLVTFGFAQVKQFGVITNLVGGFSMSTLVRICYFPLADIILTFPSQQQGLVLPPLFYIKFFWSRIGKVSLLAHALITLAGSSAVILTTAVTVVSQLVHPAAETC